MDNLVLGLILNRFWSGDRWTLTPRNYLDAAAILERHALTREAILDRARELGVLRTIRSFLQRCDPTRRHLDLTPPGRARTLGLDLAVLPERGFVGIEATLARAFHAGSALQRAASGLPHVIRAHIALRRHREINDVLHSLQPRVNPLERSTNRQRLSTLHGIKWLYRFLPLNRTRPCLTRSLATFSALSRQGWPAEFVTGIRRTTSSVIGHAWVEIDGHPVEWQGDETAPILYTETYRYPPRQPAPAAVPSLP